MATSTISVPFDNTTVTTFRAWGSAISGALAAVGLVQTADTGQINWTTVALPAANVFAGYEIWRFSDALQATAPIFLKIEYGTGSTATRPALRVSAGTGSNGSGTLTGPGAAQNALMQWTGSTNTFPSYFSSDGSYLTVGLAPSGALADHLWFFFDRTRNVDGSANADGLLFRCGYLNSAGNSLERIWSFVNNTAYNFVSAAPRLPGSGGLSSYADGTDIYVCPIPVFLPRGEAPASAGVLTFAGDIAAGTIFSTTHNGSTHTFIALGAGGTGADTVTASSSVALRYE